jgi:protein TonB
VTINPHQSTLPACLVPFRKVQPTYPPAAKQAHVQGDVHFIAGIRKDGTVEGLDLISGDPLLVDAARQAALQWEFTKTFVEGTPVGFECPITVSFTFGQ